MNTTLWNGFIMEIFDFKGREARLVYPDTPCKKLLLKTEYWDAFPNFEIEMVKRGYYLCNISHFDRWGSETETDITAEFVRFVSDKLGILEKCIPVGMSCGGLEAACLAIRHPELVSCMYLDAPVLNILSAAGLGRFKGADDIWDELVSVFGFNKSTVVNFRKSPIDNLDVLIKNDIPIILLYGDEDDIVIYEENGKVLEDYYKENGGKLEVITRKGSGHHPHSLDDPSKIIEFVEKFA